MSKKLVHNCITGEIKEVEISAEEQKLISDRAEVKKNELAEHTAKIAEEENLKASAKTKLMAGEPLTEEEANVMLGG